MRGPSAEGEIGIRSTRNHEQRITVRIVCISDTHGLHPEAALPDGDLLVHAGDLTSRGTEPQIREFDAWLGALPHRRKVAIAGNHDFLFENEPERARALITGATYLENQGIIIEGIRLWGSPIQPWFHNWAFNRERGEEIRRYWRMIPDDVEVLIVHGPPHGIGDRTIRDEHVGCADLLQRIGELTRLRLVVFGHIHEAYGVYEIRAPDGRAVPCVNASVCDVRYRPVNPAIVVEI